jgi:quinol monooxygenase YgiN
VRHAARADRRRRLRRLAARRAKSQNGGETVHVLAGWRKNIAHACLGRRFVSVHFFVRFEPQPGKEVAFRQELLRVIEGSRAETGCVGIQAFESLREPCVFAIHSEWVDEAAFDWHAQLPHTLRFLRAAEDLLTHPVHGLRSRRIDGGAGAGPAG